MKSELSRKSLSKEDIINSSKNSNSSIPWQNPSSRIIRVSRISGGKDRHSKVWTVKGLRDRRVRLSVSTAIQFYDLQDRLGYDQPSKAVDWLIKAAADAIVELPELAGPFPLPPSMDSKSTCSSETSKGSDLSFAKEKERERERDAEYIQSMGKGGSFTELLTVGGGGEANCYADCFSKGGIFGQMQRVVPQLEPSYSSMLQFGGGGVGEGHQDLQQFAFMQESGIPVAVGGGDCNVNVSFASGFGGFSRGTLQSNSQHHHQVIHGGNLPFFLSASLPISAAGGSLESQFPGGFNGRLQLCCNEAHKHPEMKGERKG